MIQANELRIGNLFQEKYTGDILAVSELTKDRITFDYQTLEKWQAEPIPLTEEILLKIGFRWSVSLTLYMLNESETICDHQDFKNEEDGEGELYTVHFYHDGEHLIIENSNEHGEYGNMRFGKIKHLHQLQNLYFALTGKELEVKL